MVHRRNRLPQQEVPGSTDAPWDEVSDVVSGRAKSSILVLVEESRMEQRRAADSWVTVERETRCFLQDRRLTSEAQRGRSVRMLLDEEGKESQSLAGKMDGGEITSELLSSIYSSLSSEKNPLVILF